MEAQPVIIGFQISFYQDGHALCERELVIPCLGGSYVRQREAAIGYHSKS